MYTILAIIFIVAVFGFLALVVTNSGLSDFGEDKF